MGEETRPPGSLLPFITWAGVSLSESGLLCMLVGTEAGGAP